MSMTCPPHEWTYPETVVWLGWSLDRRSCTKCGKLSVRRLREK